MSSLTSPLDTPEVALTVAAVARRLGVAPATLRTWDRRYGLGPSERTEGCHRRYSRLDCARLELMRQLINAGASSADAAARALELSSVEVDDVLADRSRRLEHQDDSLTTDATRGLARSALSLDGMACQRLISKALQAEGAVSTWNNLIRPVMASLGRRWQTTARGIEYEHLLSEAATTAFNLHIASQMQQPRSRPVLMAGAPAEMHFLPLVATAAALAEHSIECRMLGPNLPYSGLSAAIQRVGPAAVLVWSQSPSTGDPTPLASLPQQRAATRVFVAGPGWDEALPAGVQRLSCIVDAVNHLTGAVD